MKIIALIVLGLYLLYRLYRLVCNARAWDAQQDHRSWNDKYGGAW